MILYRETAWGRLSAARWKLHSRFEYLMMSLIWSERKRVDHKKTSRVVTVRKCPQSIFNRDLFKSYMFNIVTWYAQLPWLHLFVNLVPCKSAPNPKYYFRKNANLKLFQKRLTIFSQHLKFFSATVQPEIWYALSHDRAGEGHGSILDLTSQTVLHVCSQRVNAM